MERLPISKLSKVVCSRTPHTGPSSLSKRGGSLVTRSGTGFGKQQIDKPRQPNAQREQKPQQRQLDKGPSLPVRQDVVEVPEVINQRLLNRMLTFSLLPVFAGFLSLPLLAYVQVGLKIDLPQGTAFVVSGLCFGAGLLGITYGIMSASWDEYEEGSGLGLEEFKTNAAPLIDKIRKRPNK